MLIPISKAMKSLSRVLSGVGGRHVIVAFGAIYLVAAAGFPISQVGGDRVIGETVVYSVLLGASGLILSYTGYRLSQTNVRDDLHVVVASWCVIGLGIMLSIVILGSLAGAVSDLVAGFLVLPALASVAGLGMGYHDARARTRALDAEERQREAERYSRELERYQTIVETVNDGIFISDSEDRFSMVNDAYTELVGYDREQLIGSPVSLLAAGETDVEAMAEEIRSDITAGSAQTEAYESTIQTASGEVRDVESTVALLPQQEDASQDKVVVVRDITERKERQQRLKRQNERLEGFAGMLAHELRNPVNIGQIYSQQLPPDANDDAVEYVTEAFDRIENLIDVMLLMTRGQEAVSPCSPVQLADAAHEAWDEVDAAEATLEVTADPTIEVDETYIRHLFRNLFENAVEHGGSDVTVTVGEVPTGFYVADSGSGIPADDQELIFESGYTTASEEGGMGLGLTFVQEMADVYKWTCAVTESGTGGARFEFEGVTKDSNAAS